MRWHDLLFLHWPVRPELIRPLIPHGLELDTFDGSAWLGVVPFRMTAVRPRYFPAFAGFAFPELNVRTYVWTPGRSGVWFFSLDATNWLAVRAARAWYGLPYYDARMNVELSRKLFTILAAESIKKALTRSFTLLINPPARSIAPLRGRSTGGSPTDTVFTQWTGVASCVAETFITCPGLCNLRNWSCASTR